MAKWTNQNRALCQYLIVIIFLSSRERFPIPIRRWCRNCIGACPLGLYLDGVPCFRFDLFGLQHHQDHDHNSPFSKLRKCSPIQIWDPGDSNYISEIGGLRLLIRHTYGLLFEFVLGIGAMVLPRSQTSLLLCFDVRLVVPIICCPTTQMARSLFAVFVEDATSTLVMFPSNVSDYIDRDRIDCMMDFWLSPIGLYWFELSMLHVDSVIYWRLGFVGFDQIGRLENVLSTLRWVLLDMRGSGIGVKISTDVYGVKLQ